ncbi:MAG: adenosylcobinamide-GDP ribazoletransferase [Halomonas sp.]|nr:adenosylcobinamide-GDP ribazoletransferase [Halomonas sp.]
MRAVMHGFLLALQFLSRLPVPVVCPWTAETRRWAVRCYPLVGLLLGGIVALVGALLQDVLPSPLLALLLLSVWVALTGGLHLDGLMDVADAVGSNAPLEKRWAIMKDPHVGSFGILALAFLLLWKGALLLVLLDAGIGLAWLPLVVALARLGAVMLLVEVPTARPEGLARAWQQDLGRCDLPWALVPLTIGFLLWPGWPWLFVALVPFLIGYGLWARRAFNGINGDIVGAAIEGGELWLLLSVWLWYSSATG